MIKNMHWQSIVFIMFIGIIAYHNCLPNEMFWDDDDFILNNRYVKEFHYWPLWFSQNAIAGSHIISNYWRPLLLAVFAIEWRLFHTWVYGWHAVSIAVHIACAVALYFLIQKLFKQQYVAVASAMLFACHPICNEAVVYANSLGDSLSTLTVLLGLLFSEYEGTVFIFFPLAVMFKETGFVLLGLLPLVNYFQKKELRIFPILILGAIYIYLRATVLNFHNTFNFYAGYSNPLPSSIYVRTMTFLSAMTQYLEFMFYPHQLRVERLLPWSTSILDIQTTIGYFIVATMAGIAIYCWNKKSYVTFGIAWFFIALIPASGVLVPINATIYEHFLYLPIIGIIIIVAHHLQRQTIILVLIIFCAININRNMDWRTAIGFYEEIATYRPDDYRIINNLGMAYANKGIYDKAFFEYRKAITLDPKNPVAYHNIAGLYRDTGHYQLALDNFNMAIALNPNFIFSYQSLAALYFQLKQYKDCKNNLEQMIRIDPNDDNSMKALKILKNNFLNINK